MASQAIAASLRVAGATCANGLACSHFPTLRTNADAMYRAGDFFFETGDVSHRVNNKSDEPCTHLLFEILPADLPGASLILPRNKPAR